MGQENISKIYSKTNLKILTLRTVLFSSKIYFKPSIFFTLAGMVVVDWERISITLFSALFFGSITGNFSVFFAWIHWDNSSALTLSYRTFLFKIHFIFLFLFDLYFCKSKCFHYFIEYIKNYIINKRNQIYIKFILVLFFFILNFFYKLK